MRTDTSYDSEFAEHIRRQEQCPRSARLLEAIQQTITHAFHPALVVGSKRHGLKCLLENFVVAISIDLAKGIDSTPDDEAYVNEKIREARS